jgi:hypothetical protein
MALFYECTTITIFNGKRTPFWHSPWLGGHKPKDIAPSIFTIPKHKNVTVHMALTTWRNFHNVEWWHHTVGVNANVRKGLASLVMISLSGDLLQAECAGV